ncbi:MAG TPA: DMT family transporter [Mycobacteriales bacterium]
MTIAIILCAAVLLGLGFVLQQRAAQEAPPEDALRFKLFLDLIKKPVWLAGIGSMVGGQILGAIALGHADVILVEPLLTTNLLFALALARVISSQQLGRREWSGAIILSVGVAVFIIAGQPHTGSQPVSELRRWLVVGVVAAIAAALVAVARRRAATEKATLLASAAGSLYGLQDGFTKRSMVLLDHGIGDLVTSYLPYAVFGVAVIGLLLAQSAFEVAPLRASLPAMTVAEPLAGIAFGVGVFGEVVRLAPIWLALESAGLVAMITGVILITRSPMLHRGGAPAKSPVPQ